MTDSRLRERQHFGEGPLALIPEKSVFLNCPYDSEYAPLFDGLIFATVCCGFIPRSAMETGTVAEPRMHRITRAIFESKYSIHDLSRCRGEGDSNLARFNMPLELGIAMARRYLAETNGDPHDWLILVPGGHHYLRFVSDLAGYDPKIHRESIESLIPAVMGWLASRKDAVRTATPGQVLDSLNIFEQRLEHLRLEWRGQPPWADVVLLAMRTADTHIFSPNPSE